MNEQAAQSPDRSGGTVEPDLTDPGIVVLDQAGRLMSVNAQTRELLGAESAAVFDGRLSSLASADAARTNGSDDEMIVDVPDVGPISVRSYAVSGVNGEGRVLLLRNGLIARAGEGLLQEAARHRAFAFLARDWAHDLKGMLHVIRINGALLGRLLQRTPGVTDAAVTKCLDAIPREIERLDRSIEVMFGVKAAEQPSLFDVGKVCERLRGLIAARATRQRVEVVLELNGGPKEIVGFEDQVQSALLNILINALEAMPEQGRLVISAEGHLDGGVTVRVSDTGAGLSPQPGDHRQRARFVNGGRRPAIGLHVASAIVESHNGRIECASNVPRGTSVEIIFPSAASTERLRHGSRTHR
jgi:two-component system sensor histidine kinase HydH